MFSKSLRVLIVDGKIERDDHLDDMLTSAGITTRVANDSVSAAGALEVWKPTVAIVDLRSPSSEARRFCADVSQRPLAAHLPIILVGEGSNLLKVLPVVPAGLVPAPIDAANLVATVQRVVREAAQAGQQTVAAH